MLLHYTELQIRQGKKAEIQFPLSGDCTLSLFLKNKKTSARYKRALAVYKSYF